MDVEKTIQFILEHSAATAAQLEQLTADVADLKEVTRQHTADLEVHTAELEVHTDWKIALSQALQDLASQMKEGFNVVAAKHAELAEMQKTTQENLNILIRTVQDIIPRLPK